MPRQKCKNGGYGKVDIDGVTWTLNKTGGPCHIAAPRGAKTGTQGLKGDYERSKIPDELCEELVKSAALFHQFRTGETVPDLSASAKRLHDTMIKQSWFAKVTIADGGLIIHSKEELSDDRKSMLPKFIDSFAVSLSIDQTVPSDVAHNVSQ